MSVLRFWSEREYSGSCIPLVYFTDLAARGHGCPHAGGVSARAAAGQREPAFRSRPETSAGAPITYFGALTSRVSPRQQILQCEILQMRTSGFAYFRQTQRHTGVAPVELRC